ncbi:MAG: molybdopterin cofactor-binding domain-containing protein, partial [Pyrinomonadaceae bacterium]
PEHRRGGAEETKGGVVGRPVDRVDGRRKVTGAATYAAEFKVENLAHGVLVQSAIARGRIRELDTGEAEREPGVLAVITHGSGPSVSAGRTASPRAARDGHWLVGYGVATATYPGYRSPSSARARVLPDGTCVVQSATQDIGTGTYTVMAQVAAETLGVPISRVRAELGDSTLPSAPTSGGSQTVASVLPAVKEACEMARRELVEVDADQNRYAFQSFGAQFAEVRVDEDLGVVRVSRFVSVQDIGRVMNTKTTRSQVHSGVIYGIGMALMEETVYDQRNGRPVVRTLGDYHVPVNADVPDIEVHLIGEPDPHINTLGARGVGEIGITGVAAAIANAVYHATGKRIRDLPITPDKLL